MEMQFEAVVEPNINSSRENLHLRHFILQDGRQALHLLQVLHHFHVSSYLAFPGTAWVGTSWILRQPPEELYSCWSQLCASLLTVTPLGISRSIFGVSWGAGDSLGASPDYSEGTLCVLGNIHAWYLKDSPQALADTSWPPLETEKFPGPCWHLPNTPRQVHLSPFFPFQIALLLICETSYRLNLCS